MSASFLWPYEAVKIQFEGDHLLFHAPWLKVRVRSPLPTDERAHFTRLLAEGPQAADDLQMMHTVCSPFLLYPLFYLLPRHGLAKDPHLKTKRSTAAPAARWPVDEILSFSWVGEGQFDPVSLLSCFRLHHLKEVVAETQQHSTAASLRGIPQEQRKKALALIIRQNHYVTERCQEVLAPALNLHPAAKAKIADFMNEEKGHDRLLAHSLRVLGFPELPPLETNVRLMDHFARAAKTNLLGFCFMVDLFERSPYSGKNPVIEALIEMGEEEAAKPLKMHSEINLQGGHFNESFTILGPAGAVDEAYAREALLIAEEGSMALLDFLLDRAQRVRVL